MKGFKIIVAEYHKIDHTQRRTALATVVQVRGSSYRSPGARMLITDDGRWVGSISGGCLEGDALRKARQVMSDKKSLIATYDTREESNMNLGIGLGCNGVIDVLIEAVDPADAQNPIRQFEEFSVTQEPVALATVFSEKLMGEKLLVNAQGFVHQQFSSQALNERVKSDLLALFASRRSEARIYDVHGENIEVFIELIQPSITLIIFGGGFDARPVSQLAKSLGWNVQVTDECIAHIAPVFFPAADKLSLCQRDFIDRDFEITPYTACVLMSHNYDYDREVLKKLLTSSSPYIGILGPKKRLDKMLQEFALSGIMVPDQQLQRIHAPIGLDIGAEAPDEIAVSIIAEIQTRFSGRSGGFLKFRNGPIHYRDSDNDQVFKPAYRDNEISPDIVNIQ